MTALTEGTRISRQAVTKHLAVLARAGLVESERHGRERLWALTPGPAGRGTLCPRADLAGMG